MSASPTIVSFPKSGRTWVRYALALDDVRPTFTHAGHGARTLELGRTFRGTPNWLRDTPILFIYRNPIDTAVSYYFQLTRKDLRKSSGRWLKRAPILAALGRLPPTDIDDFVRDPRYGVPLICAFNRGWLDALSDWTKRHLVVRYEDLKMDPEA